MSVFNTIYTFFNNWLFGDGSTVLVQADQNLVCILLSVVTLVWVLYLAMLPIKAIISAIFRGV